MDTKLIAKFDTIFTMFNKYQTEQDLQEDLVKFASAKHFVNIILKTSEWLNGASPTLVDRDAFEHFQGVDIDSELHPRLHAWYEKVKGYTEAERNNWPEHENLEDAMPKSDQPLALNRNNSSTVWE